jgi:hypothetical protein
MSKTAQSAIGVLAAAAVLWYLMKILTNDVSAALQLGKEYLGFATSLAGFLGIAVGGGFLFKSGDATQTLRAVITTGTALLVTLAGGAMVGGDATVQAAALVAGGLWGAGYFLKS